MIVERLDRVNEVRKLDRGHPKRFSDAVKGYLLMVNGKAQKRDDETCAV
jgi:hypothetical protein